MRDTVIVGAARTPIGSFNGSLSQVPGPRPGAVLLQDPEDLDVHLVDHVLTMGCSCFF